MHLDWAASQLLTKQFQIGVVGYVYNEVGCDSGSGDRVGCFQSRVIGVGPQIGFVIPMGTIQGYLNFKAYMEFDSANRPDGWNTWATFSFSPSPPHRAPRRCAWSLNSCGSVRHNSLARPTDGARANTSERGYFA
jgi:hypothetical protein